MLGDMLRPLALASFALLALVACNKTEGIAPMGSSNGATSAVPSSTSAASSTAAATAAASAAPTAKKLDATGCDPGTSLEPIAKGKSVSTDEVKFTLLDARVDTIDNPLEKGKKVLLVKLEVENVSQRDDLNLSMADIEVSRDKAAPAKNESKLFLENDFFYTRTKICVDLAADVKKGTFPRGAKVIGYFVRTLGDEPYKSLWIGFKNLSPASAATGKAFTVAGTLQIK